MPKEEKKQHLKVLGLDSSATESDVRQSYSKLVLQHHPQKSSGSGSESTFEDVTKAFRFLTEMDGECSNADNDQIFLNFFRELIGSGNVTWPDDLMQKAHASESDFEYRSPYEDDVELDGDKIDCLIDIISNYKKRGKNIPLELSSERLEWCKEQLKQKDESKRDSSKKSVKKNKTAASVPVAKPKPKSKKQLIAEQRRREREMEQIAIELEGKRKEEEEREKQRKQLEVEKQKRQEEERIKAQVEARKQREREEKERERQRKIEQEREERRRKQQEEERRRKEEEEKRRKAEKEKAEKEKQIRLKAQQAAKEKEDQQKAQSLKNQANKKSVQQQQRNEQNMYPREIPPRFQKKMKQQQQSQPISQTQSQSSVTQTKQPPATKPPQTVSRKKDPNRWNNSEYSGIIVPREDDGGWSQAGPTQAGTGWLEYDHNHIDSTESSKWGSEIQWGGKEGNWDNVVVDSKDDEAWPSMNGTKSTRLSKSTETIVHKDSEWTDKPSMDKNSSWGNSNEENVNWTGQLNKAPVGMKTQSPVKGPANVSQLSSSEEKSSSNPNLSANWGGPSPSGWGGIIPYSENWDNFCDDSVDAAIDAVENSQTIQNGPDSSWNRSENTNSWSKPKTNWENNGQENNSNHSRESKIDNVEDIDSNDKKSITKDWNKTPGKGNNSKESGWNDLAPHVNKWDKNPVSSLDSIPIPVDLAADTSLSSIGTHKAPGASTLGWGNNNQSIVTNSSQSKINLENTGYSGVVSNSTSVGKSSPLTHPALPVSTQPIPNTANAKVNVSKEKNTQTNPPMWGEPQSGSTGWGETESWDAAVCKNKPSLDITGTSCWDQTVNKTETNSEKSPLNMATPTAEKVSGWLESNPPASGWGEVEDIDVAEAWGGGWTTASSKRNKAPKTAPVVNDSNAWMTRAMKQLLDMGFKQEDAEKALKANHMNIESAISDLLTMAASSEETMQTPSFSEPDPAEAAKLQQEEQPGQTEAPKLNRKQRRRLQQLAQQEESIQEKTDTSAETKLENASTKSNTHTAGKVTNSKDVGTNIVTKGTEAQSDKSNAVSSSNKSVPLSTNGPTLNSAIPQSVRPPLPQPFLQQQFMQQQLQLRFAQANLMQSPALNAQQLVMLQQLAHLQMAQQRLAQTAAQQQIAQKQAHMKPTLQQQQLALMIGQIQQQITLQQQQILARSTPQQQQILQHQQQQIQQLILQQQQKAQQQQQQQQQEIKQPQTTEQVTQGEPDAASVQTATTKDIEPKPDPLPTAVSTTSSLSTDVVSTPTIIGSDKAKESTTTLQNDIPISQPQPQITQSRLQQWRQPIPNAEVGKKEPSPIPKDQAISDPVSINTGLTSSAVPSSYSPLLSSSLSPVKSGLPKESVSSRWGVDASLRLSADPPEFKPGVPWKPREFREGDKIQEKDEKDLDQNNDKDKADDNSSVPSPSSGSLVATDSTPGSLSSSNSSLVRPSSVPDKVTPIGTASSRPTQDPVGSSLASSRTTQESLSPSLASSRPTQESLGSTLTNLSISGPYSDPMWRAPSEKILSSTAGISSAGPVRPPPGLSGKNSFVNPPSTTSIQSAPGQPSWGVSANMKPTVPHVNHSNPILTGLGYGTASPWGTGHNFHPFNSTSTSPGSWPISSQAQLKPSSEVPSNVTPVPTPANIPPNQGSLSPGKGQKESTAAIKPTSGTSSSGNPPRMGGIIPGAAGNPNQMSTWLVLRNISPRIDPNVLRDLCQQHGPLLTFQLNLRHGNSLIRYSSKEEAANARNMINSGPICGESIIASFATDADIGSFFDQSLDWSNNPIPSGPFHSGTGWPQFNQSQMGSDDIKKFQATPQPIIPNNVNPHVGKVPIGMAWGTAPIPVASSYVPQGGWSFTQFNGPGGAIPPPVGNLWSSRNEIPECHDGLAQESGLTSPSMTTFLPPGLLNGSESM